MSSTSDPLSKPEIDSDLSTELDSAENFNQLAEVLHEARGAPENVASIDAKADAVKTAGAVLWKALETYENVAARKAQHEEVMEELKTKQKKIRASVATVQKSIESDERSHKREIDVKRRKLQQIHTERMELLEILRETIRLAANANSESRTGLLDIAQECMKSLNTMSIDDENF
jgi:uncharacterized protein YfcZ (UPF0381/DUF406 family)